MRTRPLLGTLVSALAASSSAAAATPVVPPAVQAQIAARAPGLAYTPTRLAIGFRYRSWSSRPGALRIRFRNRAGREIVFLAARQRGSCRAGKEKSFQLAGNRVYWARTATGHHAWRCVTGPSGRLVRLDASTSVPPTKFADVGLGRIAASARRIG